LVDLTKLVRSLTSIYQLLPIYECVGASEVDLKRLEEISEVGDLDMERARAGVAFHREIEKRVEANLKNTEYRDSGYKLVPIVGTYQPTYLSAVLTKDGMTPICTYRGEKMLGGDGTVPMVSATPIEPSNTKCQAFVACPHGGLQNFDPVRVQIRAVLEDIDISEIKAVEEEAISLEIKDAYHSSENISGWVQYPSATRPLDVVISDEITGEEWPCELTADAEGWGRQRLRHEPLGAGSYRIRVDPGDDGEPISDVFAVIE
jgi:hypothetical protein